ncbi:MAG: PAS domain S-box protein [Spirochaetia bacterium]|nr:PAS domain S-box protein [Spirochaetia bacterium]
MNMEKKYNARFGLFFESARDCILIFNKDGVIIDINSNGQMQFGYSREEIIDKNILKFTLPKEVKYFFEQVAKLFTTGQVLFESIFCTKNGLQLPVEINARLINVGDGEAIFAIYRDITLRKEILNMCTFADVQIRSNSKNLKDGFILMDKEGKILNCNDEYLKLSGYSKDKIINMSFLDLTIKGSKAERIENFQNIIKEGHGLFESFHKTKDDKIWPVSVNANFCNIDGGRMCTFVVDLSEMQQVLTEIEQSQEIMIKIIDHSPIAMGIGHLDGNIIYVNNEMCKMLGYTKEELAKLNVKDITHSGDHGMTEENLKTLKNMPKIKTGAKRYVTKDGKIVWVHGTGTTFKDSSGKIFQVAQMIEIKDL